MAKNVTGSGMGAKINGYIDKVFWSLLLGLFLFDFIWINDIFIKHFDKNRN